MQGIEHVATYKHALSQVGLKAIILQHVTKGLFTMAKLNLMQQKFIQLYLESGNGAESVRQAGYRTKHPDKYASQLLSKPHVKKVLEEVRMILQEKFDVGLFCRLNILRQIAENGLEDSNRILAIAEINKILSDFALIKMVRTNLVASIEDLTNECEYKVH